MRLRFGVATRQKSFTSARPATTTAFVTMLRTVLCVLGLMVFTRPAWAWNAVGHSIIAEMVWQSMGNNERAAASELLKEHPHYKTILAADVPRGVDKDEWVFLTAAVWPDLVRPNRLGKTESVSKYDVYPHAIGYPFMLPAQTNHVLIEHFFIAKPDAEIVLSNVVTTLKDRKARARDRAVSLCWVLHLCGDLHQPLHAANLVTKEHPNGDELGGHHMVVGADGKIVSMHTFWDQLPGLNGSYAYITQEAKALIHDQTLRAQTAHDFAAHKTIASWTQESFYLAVQFAYSGGNLPFFRADDVNSARQSRAHIPKLSPAYIDEAHSIARRRLLLAAERELAELKQVW